MGKNSPLVENFVGKEEYKIKLNENFKMQISYLKCEN